MKKTIITIFIFIVLLFVCSCGLYQQNQIKDWIGYYIEEANKNINQNNCEGASDFIDMMIPLYQENKARIDAFFDKPEKKSCYFEHCKKRAGGSISSIYAANAEFDFINKVKSSGIFPINDTDILLSIFKKNLIEGNKNGNTPFTLEDDFYNFPELQSIENQKYMLARTIDNLKSTKFNREKQLQALATYIIKSNMASEEKQQIELVFSEINLKKKEINIIKDIFPKFAEQKQAMSNTMVYLDLKNMNSLEQEDIKKILYQRLDEITWTENSTNPNNLILSIELIRSNETTLPMETQTIAYPRTQVNFTDAFLLMPDNSTYMYEFISGGAKIEYGFSLSVKKHNKEIYKNNIRGEVISKYYKCQNQRIQNVFGGIQPATFIANSDMESKCSQSFQKSMNDLRNEMFVPVAYEILKIPDIQAICSYNK